MLIKIITNINGRLNYHMEYLPPTGLKDLQRQTIGHIETKQSSYNKQKHMTCLSIICVFIYYPARACASRSYVIGAGVHLYIYISVNHPKKV